MARVVITGGSGKLGRAVVREFHEKGYEVVNIDRAPSPDSPAGVKFTRADLTDYGQVVEALSRIDDRYTGVDGVVHLAAIPAPGQFTNSATFKNNVPTTYNVFEAARAVGITRVVWASSETLIGLPFEAAPPYDALENDPPYLPIDEEYTVRPNSIYSLGKALEEEMARHFARWAPGNAYIGLRFSNVMDDADYREFPSFNADPLIRKWNAWGYIDARDGAQACRLALESDITGFEAFLIAAEDTTMATPSAELAASVFPNVRLTRDVTGVETLLSIDKAKRMLGYAPKYSWRDRI
jgi:nucleoside-diphosphate-sugar epimerase